MSYASNVLIRCGYVIGVPWLVHLSLYQVYSRERGGTQVRLYFEMQENFN